YNETIAYFAIIYNERVVNKERMFMISAKDKGMLERGFSVLEFIAGSKPGTANINSVSKATGIPKSTVYRLVSIERELGYLLYDEQSRALSLGIKFFELAALHSNTQSLADLAAPQMRNLSALTGETIQLSVFDEDRALFISKISAQRAITIRGDIGQSEPLYATSTGKVLLAYQKSTEQSEIIGRLTFHAWTNNTISSVEELERCLITVKDEGYALADEEYDSGVIAAAVPILDSRKQIIAAICISAPKFRTTREQILEWLPELKKAAYQIGIKSFTDAK
ncbi:MAG: IclR family transcriptional regulator, partial [Bifidobacterium aquikefiri]